MSDFEWVPARETPTYGTVFGVVVTATGVALVAGALLADAAQSAAFAAGGGVLAVLGLVLTLRGLGRSARVRRATAEGIEVEGRITALRRTSTKVGGSQETQGWLYLHTIDAGAQTFSVRAHRLADEGTPVRLRHLPGREDEAVVVAVQRLVPPPPTDQQRAEWAAITARSGGKITFSSRHDEA